MAAGPENKRGLAQPPALVLVRVVGLGLLLWAIASEVRPGTTGAHLAAWVLVASLVPAWLLWSTAPKGARAVQMVTFAGMGAAGGVLAVFAHVALVFVGAAAAGAATTFELPAALGLASVGPAALGIAGAVDGSSGTLILGGLAASLAGLVIGVGRRQTVERAEQALLVAVEHETAELEHERAGVLAERNRLAREVHDVLAHTLGALSVQLEALDAQLDAVPEVPGPVREAVRRTKALASDGLVEARRAVRALRDDAPPLLDQLAKLCEARGAELVVSGGTRPLGPEATLALYRAAQEALTNAAKHAPGAPVILRLCFGEGAVTLAVENGAGEQPVGELSSSGGGYGIDGIRERVRLLGGEVAAGPTGDGWRVEARLPT